MGTLGIESAIVMTMQQSLTKMKTIAACEQAVQCLREVTCEWQAKQDTVTRSGIDMMRALHFLCPSWLCCSLTRSFAT